MKVRMLVGISGGRGDGSPWPHPGQVLEVDDAEGAHLCAGRLAVPVAEDPPVEKAVPPQGDVEARGPVGGAEPPASEPALKAPGGRQRAAQSRPAGEQG